MTQNNEQPAIHSQHANLLIEDPTSSESSWTNEKHSFYINSMEEAFVSSLYQHANYAHPCKRWQADRGEITSVFSLDLNEEVESGFSNGHVLFGFAEESQSESEPEKPSLYHDVQNNSKKDGLEEICSSNETFQDQNRNERRKTRKLCNHGVVEVQSKYNDVFEEVQSKYNDEHSSNFYATRNQFIRNKNVSKTSVKTLSRIRSFHSWMRHLPRKMARHDI
ncbi:hypothetical protein SUGI_0065370 [Cryptomeria japonica]|uniref:uncharacterized protein LOC131045013 n=1 Tax=Cryptomeria japonica TaxID=3369 RepID=UPI002408D715|nr:uncharacterized protein LOC131045013 [Cryptomeria japonica]GLJ07365.1 hypothetical protein SUGI_0065370 [Cryptomeria japonica]